ncbi:caspase family protein [Kribbella capetownensis]|uniref:Caspase family protein n=1 Tax=Kribbella capetownensis TaxID=1572659 RepID=A0A4R0JCR1_9ACTN|nr:caspase family protein [Kribbella capetownensis]TCC44491.1 caspase family protein [Kribbella capetownensis]
MDGSRVALVIANDQYDDPGLRRLVAPAQDAAALAEVLADPSVGGFEVRVLHNESAQEIRFAVEDFFADRAPEDLLLLHFSCHGLKNSAGELFLAVADTKPTRLASTALAADFVNRQMADSRAQRIALFLDCCYGGAFPRGMVVRASGEAQVRDAFVGQEEVGGGRGRVVVTASSAMEYAFEGGQLATDAATPTPSVFTSAVVDGLTTGEADRDGDGWVGLTELVGFVTDRVHRVTPNQNPQMWTFGSQGELLIARSRVRRITPTPLAPALLEAMESPLPAARFGVVDYLRERLDGDDLGQAYAAWQALHRMVTDDSRKVSEAAGEAIAAAVPRVTPGEVALGEDVPSVELQVSGPPIAQTAVASPGAAWVRVEQEGTTVRVTADPADPGNHESSLIVAGPTGECTVPVHLTLPETKPEPPPPEPEPELAPASDPQPEAAAASKAAPVSDPQPETVAAFKAAPVAEPASVSEPVAASKPAPVAEMEPEPIPKPAPQPPPSAQPEPGSAPPWWAIAVLALGGVALVYLNWPGPQYAHYVWNDHDDTGWYVYRGWGDPVILSSLGALVASLVARWSGPIAIGVVAGCAASVLEDGVLILGAGISADETGPWIASTAVAAVMIAVLVIVLRPIRLRFWPVLPAIAALIVAGGLLLLVSALIEHPDGISWFRVTKLALLEPVVTVGLAWLAVAATARPSRIWLSTAVTTYAVVSSIAAVPAATLGDSPAAFRTALAGNALVVAGVLIREWRLRSRP